MNNHQFDLPEFEKVLAPFPSSSGSVDADKTNPAVRLYGRRFYKDQTPVEYLAEFLLVFVSPKCDTASAENNGSYAFRGCDEGHSLFQYWPKSQPALKLFSFFPSSKLETRHQVHHKAYLSAIEDIKAAILSTHDEQEEAVRLIQSLLGGFVGVAKNRTWVTYSFLPVSNRLLSRELDWLNSKANRDPQLSEWKKSEKYFAKDRHNFMARGGELLFLQLANLFSNPDALELTEMKSRPEYLHLGDIRVQDIERDIKRDLKFILEDAVEPLNALVGLIENKLSKLSFENDESKATLGWVPAITRNEALLFAFEIRNICSLNLSSLEKLDFLQMLCCFQVLRSLCFQASRIDDNSCLSPGFAGNYAWIVCNPESSPKSAERQMAQSSLSRIEAILYRVLRHEKLKVKGSKSSIKEADEHGFKIFKKIAKEIGFVIPKKGSGERFVLHPSLLRFLVAALVKPGDYLRLTEFYKRVFAHYGIALGGEPLATAVAWSSGGAREKNYGLDVSTAWVEEALQQGGFLIELSDAVSIVHNPGPEETR
jgi:hypothetical protein